MPVLCSIWFPIKLSVAWEQMHVGTFWISRVLLLLLIIKRGFGAPEAWSVSEKWGICLLHGFISQLKVGAEAHVTWTGYVMAYSQPDHEKSPSSVNLPKIRRAEENELTWFQNSSQDNVEGGWVQRGRKAKLAILSLGGLLGRQSWGNPGFFQS